MADKLEIPDTCDPVYAHAHPVFQIVITSVTELDYSTKIGFGINQVLTIAAKLPDWIAVGAKIEVDIMHSRITLLEHASTKRKAEA